MPLSSAVFAWYLHEPSCMWAIRTRRHHHLSQPSTLAICACVFPSTPALQLHATASLNPCLFYGL